jgi:(1->4)-alpha-D-glucan 1-alpha-D-glucosylmutase
MGDPRELAALCARHGIATEWQDVWGEVHQVPEESLLAIARAFASEEDAGRAEAPALPPMVVTTQGQAVRIPVTLRDVSLRTRLAWQLELEDGTRYDGEFTLGALPVHAEGDRDETRMLEVPGDLAIGYHTLSILRSGTPVASTCVAIAPTRCYRPVALEGGGRLWGCAAQLYAVRSERNWGMGDFTDLRTIIEQWGARGAGVIGVNPLHALYPDNPEHASPYSPSSRIFLNVLYIDVEAVEDFRECDEAQALARSAAFQTELARLRELPMVDYRGVAAAKFAVLEKLYASFRERHLETESERAAAFRAFERERGEPLARQGLFEALQEHFRRADANTWGWPVWPEAYRDPNSPEVAAFARENVARIGFFVYLQWQADLQLGAAGAAAARLGLGVGLYEDLAVSVDRGGAETWSHQDLYVVGASVGAPPDEFNTLGQDWGLPPLNPERLRAAAYAPFIDMLRANMRHAGALRLDHAMGLMRLYWVPPDASAAAGAYVSYPFDDLLALLALESERNRCMVIGEALGTVPRQVLEGLDRFGVLAYSVLWLERGAEGGFPAPPDYPPEALVAATTHDLPTVAGWWEGRDLGVRDRLGVFPSEEVRLKAVLGRAEDRVRLLASLEREKLLPPGAALDPASMPAATPEFVQAVHAFLARTPSKLFVAQLEDLLGVLDQINVPGTTEAKHPNWRRKLPLTLERLPQDARFLALSAALASERPHPRVAERVAPVRARIPRATYRLQLHAAFTCDDAARVVPYLARLGVSHVYLSPVLRARPGSTHGYDIIDHSAFNPELGGREGFDRLAATARDHGLGLILDIVPNHMGVMGADNAWWMDVLENGPASVYAGFFDIEWEPLDEAMRHRVLLPVLGAQYGDVLESGELVVAFEPEAAGFAVRYYGHRFPVDPREYPRILEPVVAPRAAATLDAALAAELASLISAFGHLPARDDTRPEAIAERQRDKELHKRRFARLVADEPAVRVLVDRAVTTINGTPGDRASFDALHALLEAQAYRLAYWRVASDEINYRRFFDINDLAALRMENEAVFEATHGLVLQLAADGRIDGLRIDHPDGLYDPEQYFRRLQERYARLAGVELGTTVGGRPPRPLWVVAEKITARYESLPERWPVHGTVGYRFATVANGLFVDGTSKTKLIRTWRAFSGLDLDFEEAAYQGKRRVMRAALASELTVLSATLLRLARADRRTRDFTFNTLRLALAEVVACFPVYRTYIAADRCSAQDRRYIDWAVARAKRRTRAGETSIYDFIRRAMLAQAPEDADEDVRAQYCAFAMKLQQFTAPVTAKGVEDSAFYVFMPLTALNEVGADPDMFGMTVAAFHAASADRCAKWSHTMLATSTHDNKRSEDVRARIDVLSEMPAAWRLLLRRWSRMNRSRRRVQEGELAPSPNDEYLLYQTLLGTYPVEPLDQAGLDAYRARIHAYMQKAVREAKQRSSWINVNEGYESAVRNFVDALLGRREGNRFLDDLAAQGRAVAWFGRLNTLAMTLVKLASPGVPDIYQGTELPDLSLVDPDNRRPVDFGIRGALAEELEALAAAPVESIAERVAGFVADPLDPRAKLWVVMRALALRRSDPELFETGAYLPLEASGPKAAHVVAFARRRDDRCIVTVAGRLFATLVGEPDRLPLGEAVWGDTSLDLAPLAGPGALVDAFTGTRFEPQDGRLPVAAIMSRFPGALLERLR